MLVLPNAPARLRIPLDDTLSRMSSDSEVELLARFLRDRDLACPRCGYSLRGLASNACHECGDRLRLQVGLVEPKLGPYTTTLVAWSVALGGSALFGSLALSAAPTGWWERWCGRLMIAMFLLSLLALPGALLGRRRLRRLTPFRQWVIAVTSATIVVGLSIAIVATFED